MDETGKECFWALIQEAKDRFGQDMDAAADWLTDALIKKGPASAQKFHDIFHAYSELANQYGIWDAASVLKEHGCSDDGFLDFRAWLIAQGRDTYLAALRDPDSLVDIAPYGDCCFERLAYVGDYAYQQTTGRSAYVDTDWTAFQSLKSRLGKEIIYKAGIQYPREPGDLPAFLPKLCTKYGGIERFHTQASTWNHDLHEIRRLLDSGKRYDRTAAAKQKKANQRGDAR